MDPISAITSRVDAIESRIRSGPVATSGRFAEVLQSEMTAGTSAVPLGYGATASAPGGSALYGATPTPASMITDLARSSGALSPGALSPVALSPVALSPATQSAQAAGIGSTELPYGPAEVKSPGDYGPLVPPTELAAYGNGTIPASALAEIGVGDHRLWAPAASAFRQMRAAAAADGVDIGVTDSYRSLASQQRLAEQKGLYSEGGLAATPGTSNHGWGMALDLDLDDQGQAWMRANGTRFGFVEDVPREPWHWTFRPVGR
jgi:hypothetical protein